MMIQVTFSFFTHRLWLFLAIGGDGNVFGAGQALGSECEATDLTWLDRSLWAAPWCWFLLAVFLDRYPLRTGHTRRREGFTTRSWRGLAPTSFGTLLTEFFR